MKNMGKNQYFGSGWNWIDISMIGLVFLSYSMWVIMYFVNPGHKDDSDRYDDLIEGVTK